MGKLEFCRRFIHLDGRLISFANRPYLPAIYAEAERNLILRFSRQTEKTTSLVNTLIYEACMHPGIKILFVCPRDEQARLFSTTRLMPAIEQSPLIRRALLAGKSRMEVKKMQFANGSTVFIRSAYLKADSCRGISADLFMGDELQDIAPGHLPVLLETLSHSLVARTILAGTPKHIDNCLEAMFRRSTANEWTMDCRHCGKSVIPDEHCVGPTCLICPGCGTPVDPRQGRWLPRNPDSTWGAGYWINYLMVPWSNYDQVLERQRTYDIPLFKNEVLGLPTTTGDCIVTRAELEACCEERTMARTAADVPAAYRPRLVAGIDWGGGSRSRTAIVLGYMANDCRFHIVRFERFAASEEPDHVLQAVAERCRQFGIQWLAADGGGNGHVFNRLLYDRLHPRGYYAVLYSEADHEPQRDGVLLNWTVDRSATIGVVMSRVKKGQIRFPRAMDCGSFLDEFACEIAEYDAFNRTVKYTHPETMQDDALHAANYALLVGTHMYQALRRAS
jgi:hypothetical protein